MNITNFDDHPGDNRYYVFKYRLDEHADEFATLLQEKNVVYERFYDEDNDMTLFGIAKTFSKEAIWCNNIVHGRHRKPFISIGILRWALLIVTAGMILLALIGYFKST